MGTPSDAGRQGRRPRSEPQASEGPAGEFTSPLTGPGRRGTLIVLEGVDGSGKSTLCRRLAEAIRGMGLTVLTSREPTGGPYGQRIRDLARTGREAVTPAEEFGLFHLDRADHVREVIRPALERGEVVVQDRSYFSSVAYQGERGLDRRSLLEVSESVAPRPDLLLVVDVPAEVALERITRARGGAPDHFESLESLRRVRQVFLGFEGAIVLDGTRTPDEVLERALEAVRHLLARP